MTLIKLRDWRTANSLTLREAARSLGCSTSMLFYMERGRRRTPKRIAVQIQGEGLSATAKEAENRT